MPARPERLPSTALAWASSTTDSSHEWVTRTKQTPPASPGKTSGGGAAAQSLPEDMLEQFGFVGTTEECVERLEQEQAAGALLHSVNVMEDDHNEFAKILDSLKG